MERAPIELVTFGKPVLLLDGKELALNSRKSLALLAYLSTRENLCESRERLAGLLWGDSSEEKARASLRQTLAKFREFLPEHAVESDRLDVRLAPTAFNADHSHIVALLNAGVIDQRLVDRPRIFETFLEGYEDLDSGFRNWSLVFRRSIEDKITRLLEARLAVADGYKNLRDAATAILNIDPTHEPAARAAMLALNEEGEMASALRVYKQLWDVLDRDFDTEPSEETQKLVARIKLGEKPQTQLALLAPQTFVDLSPAQMKLPRQDIGHTLCVAHFDYEQVAGERKSVVRIFRTELLAALARFRDWRVYEEDQISRQHVGMAHAVEASAYDDGMALRFVLTLREIATGKFVWSERFSLGSDAWFGTMQTVIRRIAVALEVNISSERLERVAGRPDVSLELFDRWLKGQQSIFRWKPEDEAIAESLFRSIIREAPHFAPAHAGIAGILNVRHLIFPGIYRSEAAQREALAFALRAVELDPLDSRTQLHLGWSFAMNGEFQKAAMTFQLAFELNPDDPWTLVSSAEGLALCGSMRESLTLVQLAQQTGFMFSELQWSYQAAIWFMAGKYEDCITAAANADSALNCSGAFAAAAYGLTGRPDKAKSTATKFVARIQDIWVAREKPTDREVVRWLLLGFPIASEDVRQKLGQGLAIAGLPLPSHALAGARG